MTIAELYLSDIKAWASGQGWTYKDGIFTSSTGTTKTIAGMYLLWIQYR